MNLLEGSFVKKIKKCKYNIPHRSIRVNRHIREGKCQICLTLFYSSSVVVLHISITHIFCCQRKYYCLGNLGDSIYLNKKIHENQINTIAKHLRDMSLCCLHN